MFDFFTDLFGSDPPEVTTLPAELPPGVPLPFEIPPDWIDSAIGGDGAVAPGDSSLSHNG